MMNKIYVIAAMCAGIVIAYLIGGRVEMARCRAQVALDVIHSTNQTAQKKRKINEKVFNTGVNDIRDILRDKYTIAD